MSQRREEIAAAVARAMYAKDHTAHALGIEITATGPGVAEARMRVREDMVNGHGTCHGGMIFSLADDCFAYACNSENVNAVAVNCSIHFVRAAYAGEVLTARAREVSSQGRNGLYDITVTNERGQLVAEFRGQSRRIRGHVVPGLTESESEES